MKNRERLRLTLLLAFFVKLPNSHSLSCFRPFCGINTLEKRLGSIEKLQILMFRLRRLRKVLYFVKSYENHDWNFHRLDCCHFRLLTKLSRISGLFKALDWKENSSISFTALLLRHTSKNPGWCLRYIQCWSALNQICFSSDSALLITWKSVNSADSELIFNGFRMTFFDLLCTFFSKQIILTGSPNCEKNWKTKN